MVLSRKISLWAVPLSGKSTGSARPPPVAAAGYARLTERLPETCAGLKADPAALEYKHFTYVAAGGLRRRRT
jgi:hypothetical protein